MRDESHVEASSRAASRPVAELSNVTKAFPDFAVTDISLNVYPGEVHVVVGENGSGKSTIMKLLAGWFPPSVGSIRICGEPLTASSIANAQSTGVLYLHQDVQTFENLTIAENVYVGDLPTSKLSRLIFDRTRMLIECRRVFSELGVGLDVTTLLRSLGYAERQLISAVRAYVSDARLVIFDEPTSAMNESDREILFTIIDRLKAAGRAVFYISHRLDEIQRVGDRVTVVHKGAIVATRPCDQVDHDVLVRMMTGDVHRKRYPRLESRPGPVILKVTDLVVQPALTGVSFALRRGEVLGITGLMGSGRSLLANCLFGLVGVESGSIEIDGVRVGFSHPAQAMAKGISLIPEDRVENGIFSRHNLVTNTTTATLGRYVNRGFLDEHYMRDITKEYADELGIAPGRPHDTLATYSGGNQQKVLVARWLLNRSRIYIMDEPTRGIDVASRVDIYNAMNDLTTKGAAVILISSQIEEILGMSDRILVLAGGTIASEMTWDVATKEQILHYSTTSQ